MEDKGEVLYELKPKFDFFYEIMMPTGKKMKSALISIILTVVIEVILALTKGYVLGLNNPMVATMFNVCNIIVIIAIVFTVLLFIARIVIQSLEYKGMSYKFYKNCMIFENTFLSQTRKTIEYSDIKEVEIRRTIMDRIMNYGVIILYTSAEKAFGNATILYAIKNTQEHYNNIESLIHSGKITTVSSIQFDEKNDDKVIDVKQDMAAEDENDSSSIEEDGPIM